MAGDERAAGQRAADEGDLVERLKRGEASAFDEIYRRYRPRLFGFLARMTRNRELAEDLLQETWIRLAHGVRALRDDARLAPWLFSVARNLYRSHQRWTLVDLEHRSWLKRTMTEGIENTSPFDLTLASELERSLETAIALLPVKYREVVLLVGLERMEPADAASVLGLKPAALRQRLRRGRTMIAQQIGLPAGVAARGGAADVA